MSLLRRLKRRPSSSGARRSKKTGQAWMPLAVEELEGGAAGQLLGVEVLEPSNDEYDKLIHALKPTATPPTDEEGTQGAIKGILKRKLPEDQTEGDDDITTDRRKKKKNKKLQQQHTTPAPATYVPTDGIEDLNGMNEWKAISSLLPDQVLMGLKGLGFTTPTSIQRYSIPPALLPLGKDVLAAAETGSGKTLAYGIPLFTNILYMQTSSSAAVDDNNSDGRRKLDALIVVPTRELAMQVHSHLLKAGRYIPHLLIAPMVGGMSIQKQHRLINKVPNIIVATPGRLAALLGCATIKSSADVLDRADTEIQASDKLKKELLPQLRTIVLDEADRLVADEGHFKDLSRVLDAVYTTTQANKIQHLVFSATLATESSHITGIVSKREKKRIERSRKVAGDKITRLLSKLRLRGENHREVIDLTKEGNVVVPSNKTSSSSSSSSSTTLLPDTLTFEEIRVSVDKDREAALVYYLHKRFGPGHDDNEHASTKHGAGGKIIMFVNSISYVYRLSSILSLATPDKVNVCGMHSDLKQKDRLKKLEKFRNSRCGVLVTTDLAARGLDLPDVDTVIHVNCPRVLELFIHRSGRTARAGRKGNCIIIRTPCEDGAWRRTLEAVNVTAKDIIVNSRDISFIKHLLLVVNDYEGAQHREQRDNKEKAWMRKMAQDADLPLSDIDDDNANDDDDEDEFQGLGRRGSTKGSDKRSKQLSEIKDLLATPLPSLRRGNIRSKR